MMKKKFGTSTMTTRQFHKSFKYHKPGQKVEPCKKPLDGSNPYFKHTKEIYEQYRQTKQKCCPPIKEASQTALTEIADDTTNSHGAKSPSRHSIKTDQSPVKKPELQKCEKERKQSFSKQGKPLDEVHEEVLREAAEGHVDP